MRFRVLSDLHVDQNKYFELEDKETFTIISGDISKDINQLESWMVQNIHQGLFILGNHDFTGSTSMLEAYEILNKKFPIDNSLSFLQNNYKEIEGKIFVGATLWTDFKLNINNIYRTNSSHYNRLYGFVRGNFNKDQKLSLEITTQEFRKSLLYIEYICNKFLDKDIIVITHHCPSMKCSAPKYINNTLNPALISNLEDFIEKHKNIKAWICGHCHRDPLLTNIGQCKLIMNTRGYCKFNECPNFQQNFVVEI